jgi:hypothetical protein
LKPLLSRRTFVNSKTQFLTLVSSKARRKSLVWLLTGLGLAILWDWNWQLVLATGVGIGSMFSVHLLLAWDWESYWQECLGFFQKPSGKLTLGVTGGSLAALTTYIAATVLTETENMPLAIATLGQVFATIVILILLLRQILVPQQREKREDLQDWLLALGDGNPLRRLVAVRHLTWLSQKTLLETDFSQEIEAYFRLMLTQENHPQVREALLISLRQQPLQPLKIKPQPLKLSPKIRQTRKIPS